ncbi:hypothetical protein [Candidatus Avelusimicrobium gallicola]|uniref:Uncharacterized protein n=1 Tax=Candidatus Avelusimicrobium gallicola TaxID=2562704 RepID=A0A1Y4DEB2_9BACT|nr:hypothetical protein [Elusimicrobium sp. An273]OUO57484.1 hypothetical protein B5F75_01555 [Elusimicrobium sp. An273]
MNLFENPFNVFGVSTRDNRKQILEIAKEKILSLDSGFVSDAKLMLTTPSKRINAEIAWLPGLSKNKCQEVMQFLANKNTDLNFIGTLPPLPALNVLVSMVNYWDNLQPKLVVELMIAVSTKYEDINVDNLTTILNEERDVAKIPAISSSSIVGHALEVHKNYCIEQIQYLLDKLSIKDLTSSMLLLMERCLKQEKRLTLVDALIDKSYAIKVQPYVLDQSDKIQKIASAINKKLSGNLTSSSVDEAVEEFIRELSVFDEMARPIQLSMKQRGLEHQGSKDIAYVARGLAIDLLNKAKKEELSEKLMKKVQELFIEIPSVEERVSADLQDLKEIQEDQKEWEKGISCSVSQWGWGHKLDISPTGITVSKSRHYKLEEISSIRYGVTKKYTNGIYTGTDTLVHFGTEKNGFETITWLDYKNGNWNKFVNCLYRAVGWRIFLAMISKLALGGNLYGVIYDDKVLLAKTHFYTPTEKQFFSWNEVVIFSQNGFFVIANKNDKAWQVSFSYQEDDNTHIIDNMIHEAFKKGAAKLSRAFGMTKERAKQSPQFDFGPEKNLDSLGYIFTWIFTIVGVIFLLVWMSGCC